MTDLPYGVITINDDVRLVQLQPEQADRIFYLTQTNRDYLSEFLPWVAHTKTVDDSRAFIMTMLRRRQIGAEYGYGIEYKGEIVGHSSLMHLSDGTTPEIGYWISAEYKGRGITSAVAKVLTAFAFHVLDRDIVQIRAEQRNGGSNRIAEKCGYRMAGTMEEDGRILNVWKKARNE